MYMHALTVCCYSIYFLSLTLFFSFSFCTPLPLWDPSLTLFFSSFNFYPFSFLALYFSFLFSLALPPFCLFFFCLLFLIHLTPLLPHPPSCIFFLSSALFSVPLSSLCFLFCLFSLLLVSSLLYLSYSLAFVLFSCFNLLILYFLSILLSVTYLFSFCPFFPLSL